MKINLKIIPIILTASLFFAKPVCAGDIYLNNELIEFTHVQPMIVQSRVMVPVREFFEKVGYEVQWDAENKKATLYKSGKSYILYVGNNIIYRDGYTFFSDVPPQIVSSRIFLPLRAVLEVGGYTVDWDAQNGNVYISEGNDDFIKSYLSVINGLNIIDETAAKINGLSEDNIEQMLPEIQSSLLSCSEALKSARNGLEKLSADYPDKTEPKEGLEAVIHLEEIINRLIVLFNDNNDTKNELEKLNEMLGKY